MRKIHSCRGLHTFEFNNVELDLIQNSLWSVQERMPEGDTIRVIPTGRITKQDLRDFWLAFVNDENLDLVMDKTGCIYGKPHEKT